jgi:hypothetical protein
MNAKIEPKVRQHGEQLIALFGLSKDTDPIRLCQRLRRLEVQANTLAVRYCNGEMDLDGIDRESETILPKVKAILAPEYQPKTGAACGCKRGVQRDNCPACEGTGHVIDFRAIRTRPQTPPIFFNRDPRGYALKIPSEWMHAHPEVSLHRDWGGYGILAPDLS